MCQRKPGPRCAGHLSDEIAKVKSHIAENRVAELAGAPHPHPGSTQRLMMLNDEYDETPSGQKALDEQMANTVGAPREVWRLRNRKAAAARRYATKKAALAAADQGDERASNIILKTGNPDAGWTANSYMNPLNRNAYRRMQIANDGGSMVGVVSTETEDSYDSDAPVTIATTQVVYETPITEGPYPGTYITHGTGSARAARDPYLYMPADIDSPEPTIRSYSEQASAAYGTTLAATDVTESSDLDPLLGYDSADDYTVEWEQDPEIVHDRTGKPAILRFYGTARGAVRAQPETALVG